MITLYNPNLTAQKGIFLRVPHHLRQVVASKVREGQIRKVELSDLVVLQTESLCPESYFKNDGDGQDLQCNVFIDVEIEGLSFTHFKVELLSPVDMFVDTQGKSQVARTEVLYRYDPYDYKAKLNG